MRTCREYRAASGYAGFRASRAVAATFQWNRHSAD